MIPAACTKGEKKSKGPYLEPMPGTPGGAQISKKKRARKRKVCRAKEVISTTPKGFGGGSILCRNIKKRGSGADTLKKNAEARLNNRGRDMARPKRGKKAPPDIARGETQWGREG